MKINFIEKFQLFIVRQAGNFLNFTLAILKAILFPFKVKEPKNILIYKLGNIGDVVCAIPSFIAIRHKYPNSKITLLTSPGKKGAIGAAEILEFAKYFDNLQVYYSDDIDTFKKIGAFVEKLKSEKFDLFIQLPDDWVKFRTLARNIIFAKVIGAKSAIGFVIRTVNLFKKTQVDRLFEKNEVESLLNILKNEGIGDGKVGRQSVENISVGKNDQEVKEIFSGKFNLEKNLIIGICPGGKGDDKKWPAERFGEVSKYLKEKYGAKFVIFGGGNDDKKSAKIISNFIGADSFIDFTGCDILKSIAGIKYCRFLLTNDTGLMHVAAAFNIPVVAIFSIRSVFGKWFPYGSQHKILYHRFIGCNYSEKECIKKSVDMVSVDDVKKACDDIIKK